MVREGSVLLLVPDHLLRAAQHGEARERHHQAGDGGGLALAGGLQGIEAAGDELAHLGFELVDGVAGKKQPQGVALAVEADVVGDGEDGRRCLKRRFGRHERGEHERAGERPRHPPAGVQQQQRMNKINSTHKVFQSLS